MLRTFFAHLLERSARIEPRDSFSFVGQYSAFSGIVTEISVGSLRQELLVSLSFDEDVVSFYDTLACPAFVVPCYTSTYSPSFADGRDYIDLPHGRSLGSVRIESNVEPRSSSRFSEVAGWIGASPRAFIFQSKALRIQEISAHQGVEIREVAPDAPPGELEARIPVFGTMRGWVVHGRTRLQGQLLPNIGLVLFDPGEQDLVIPDVLREDVVLLIDGSENSIYKNRLVIPCNSPLEVELIFPNPGLHFRLDSLIFFIPNSHPPNRLDYCITRIRFDSGNFAKVVVGRILTRSSGSVTLNFKHRWIGLSVASLVSEPFPSPRARIPVLRLPRLPRHSNKLTLAPIASPEDYPDGIILASTRERGLGFAEIRGFGYCLIRVSPHPRNVLHGIYRVRIEAFSKVGQPQIFTDDSIEFRLSRGDSPSEVLLVYAPTHVGILQVARAQPVLMHRIVVPVAEEHEGGPIVECPICLDSIREGEIKQRIDPCKHYFHRSCLFRWVERLAKPTCPMCRNEILRVVV